MHHSLIEYVTSKYLFRWLQYCRVCTYSATTGFPALRSVYKFDTFYLTRYSKNCESFNLIRAMIVV